MKRIYTLGVILCSAIVSPKIFAQEKHKFSISNVATIPTNESGLLNGWAFEYGYSLNNRLMISLNMQFDRLNSFPKYTNKVGAINTSEVERETFFNNVAKDLSLTDSWKKVSQNIYTINADYSVIKSNKNRLYLTAGVGVNIQDVLEYGLSKIEKDTNGTVKSFEDYTSHYTTTLLIAQGGVGYEYTIKNNWFVGTDFRFQLPISKDENLFSKGGVNYNETFKLGIKVGKRF